ncbi:MAG TPA: protein-disulfide reductase DsbD domain-containing protein [Verrucomicrobiales bacterium]|nr:protein-disulfide reductase DsbD domain-containing protein [Verrucomicrobiales bacterium]
MKLFPLIALWMAFTSVLNAADTPAPWKGTGLTVQLVSEVTAIHPGQPYYTGLFIHHDAGHHTYWKKPGILGVATKLEWELPKGWKAGEIEWPAPEKVKMASRGTHGYERDVLLMVKITPPAKISEKTVTLKTKASWMCCGTTCNPAYHDLEITQPVSAEPEPGWNPQWHKVFEEERGNFPVPLTGWKLHAVRDGETIILTGEPEKKGTLAPQEAVFFSDDDSGAGGEFLICSDLPQKWTVQGEGFRVELPVSEWPPKNQSVLRGVITGKKAWLPDGKKAALLEVPVKKAPDKK